MDKVKDYIKYILAALVLVALVYIALIGMDAFTPDVFVGVSAALLAAAFDRFPWLKEQWDKLSPGHKQLLMAIFLAVLVWGAFGLSCAGIMGAFPCTVSGALNALYVMVIAIGINQGTHLLTRKL